MKFNKELSYVYSSLEKDLEQQIKEGVVKPDECILSENELSQKYHISRMSARKAITNLVRKGLLYRVSGKGTFVIDLEKQAGLDSKKLKTFSFIIPDIEDTFIAEIYRGIEEVTSHDDYHVLVQSSNSHIEKEVRNISSLKEHKVSGAVIFPNWGRFNAEAIFDLKKDGIPFVLIDRYFRDIRTDYVIVDNSEGAHKAVTHLINLGHKRIGHICGVECTANEDRLEGYKQALSKAKIVYEPSLVRKISPFNVKGSIRFEPDDIGGYEEMKKLLSLNQRPTAVFAGNDYLALGALKAIREAGLKIPDDIAVVGFDDLKISSMLETPLTTIRQPKYEIGKRAARILVEKIEANQEGRDWELEQVVLKTELVVRKSCGGENK